MKKSIIIDFDNTIGYFSQIIYLINIIHSMVVEGRMSDAVSVSRIMVFTIFLVLFPKHQSFNGVGFLGDRNSVLVSLQPHGYQISRVIP